MIKWNCIACQEMLEAPESLSGGSLACPSCGIGNAVPGRFLAHVNRKWFLVALAGGMLIAGLWVGVRMNRPTAVDTVNVVRMPDRVRTFLSQLDDEYWSEAEYLTNLGLWRREHSAGGTYVTSALWNIENQETLMASCIVNFIVPEKADRDTRVGFAIGVMCILTGVDSGHFAAWYALEGGSLSDERHMQGEFSGILFDIQVNGDRCIVTTTNP